MFTRKDFSLTDKQHNDIKKWADTHKCSCRYGELASRSCCGGEISITFTPTTVGLFITAKCVCGAEYKV